MMRADYDSKADTIQIELETVRRLDRDDAGIPGVVVGFADGRPVMVDLIGTETDVDERLRAAAKSHDLDVEALIAAATVARAAPDRTVTLDVAIRATA